MMFDVLTDAPEKHPRALIKMVSSFCHLLKYDSAFIGCGGAWHTWVYSVNNVGLSTSNWHSSLRSKLADTASIP